MDLAHLLRSGTGSGEGTTDVGKHLTGLESQITGADEVALLILGFLAGDEHQPASSRDNYMGVRRGSGQVLGIDELERQ